MPIHRSTNKIAEQESEHAFAHMLHALLKRQAFPFVYETGEDPYLIQTHASAVIITPDYVYKLKKPRDFGFFDYSTIDQRRHFCQLEVQLNSALAPGVYLGVAPAIEKPNGTLCFGDTYPPASEPTPGHLPNASGTIIDYAVVMRRLPESATLHALLEAGKVTPELMGEIAHVVAQFHSHTPTNDYISKAGSIQVIRENWGENFRQMRPYCGRTISRKTYTALQHYIYQCLKHDKELFRQRFMHDYIRDCHGDLRLQHIYVLPEEYQATLPRIILLDRIEFNERIRYGDVASEVAFLYMELDFAWRPDLAHIFLTRYIAETGDASLIKLLPFYACYRACVRGKVISFLLDDSEVGPEQRTKAQLEASELFKQALRYTRCSSQPHLIIVGGVMGSGKSTIARQLQDEYAYALLSTDSIRKQLTHLPPDQPQAEQFGAGIYDPSWTRQTYAALNERAQAYLQQGYSVIVDGTYSRRADRQEIAQAAVQHGASVIFIECICPREVTLQRLDQRWRSRIAGEPALAGATNASDGRPELYDTQVAHWEAFDSGQEPMIRHIALSTTGSQQTNMEALQHRLHPLLTNMPEGKNSTLKAEYLNNVSQSSLHI
ncbi:bifunctional aminoglycoside phosphotransferase/ATP-binding protein [Dictyobacter formicarum]|uniref:Kinase n=1 Tax=Dictyobacter formicarum TaxID=2778368 RepID=A0ABQ3VE61_9CHLR|nr:AAA family ATPase [Dictyobacter formicarum]GHO84437.1 kinase [Dictyobacter formicarum]